MPRTGRMLMSGLERLNENANLRFSMILLLLLFLDPTYANLLENSGDGDLPDGTRTYTIHSQASVAPYQTKVSSNYYGGSSSPPLNYHSPYASATFLSPNALYTAHQQPLFSNQAGFQQPPLYPQAYTQTYPALYPKLVNPPTQNHPAYLQPYPPPLLIPNHAPFLPHLVAGPVLGFRPAVAQLINPQLMTPSPSSSFGSVSNIDNPYLQRISPVQMYPPQPSLLPQTNGPPQAYSPPATYPYLPQVQPPQAYSPSATYPYLPQVQPPQAYLSPLTNGPQQAYSPAATYPSLPQVQPPQAYLPPWTNGPHQAYFPPATYPSLPQMRPPQAYSPPATYSSLPQMRPPQAYLSPWTKGPHQAYFPPATYPSLSQMRPHQAYSPPATYPSLPKVQPPQSPGLDLSLDQSTEEHNHPRQKHSRRPLHERKRKFVPMDSINESDRGEANVDVTPLKKLVKDKGWWEGWNDFLNSTSQSQRTVTSKPLRKSSKRDVESRNVGKNSENMITLKVLPIPSGSVKSGGESNMKIIRTINGGVSDKYDKLHIKILFPKATLVK